MDNYQRWLHYERDKENWLKSRPICSCCGEHIQDEEAYEIDRESVLRKRYMGQEGVFK